MFSSGGPSQICVDVPIQNDDLFEAAEFFSVVLENIDGTAPTDPSRASIIINDDDCKLCM